MDIIIVDSQVPMWWDSVFAFFQKTFLSSLLHLDPQLLVIPLGLVSRSHFFFMEGPTIQNLQFSASQFQCSALDRPQYLTPPGCMDPSPGLNDEKKTAVKMDGLSRLGKQQGWRLCSCNRHDLWKEEQEGRCGRSWGSKGGWKGTRSSKASFQLQEQNTRDAIRVVPEKVSISGLTLRFSDFLSLGKFLVLISVLRNVSHKNIFSSAWGKALRMVGL